MKIKMKNRSHRYDTNRPRSRHGHKYSEYKKCLSMMMHICIKQHLRNIWNSIHEKVKQHWGWVEKRVANKKVCISEKINYYFANIREWLDNLSCTRDFSNVLNLHERLINFG